MSFSAGLDCDIRVGGAVSWPTNPELWEYDEDLPLLTEELCDSPAEWWIQLWEYWVYQTIPPGRRVVCGQAIPYFSNNADPTPAGVAAGLISLPTSYNETALEICNQILDYVGSPWSDEGT